MSAADTSRDDPLGRDIPFREYQPTFSREDYAQIARLLDQLKVDAAQSQLDNDSARGGDAA